MRLIRALSLGLLLLSVPTLCWALYENGDLKYYDPRSSEGQSGHDTPREYFLPNLPTFEQYDPAEFGDYGHSMYSPYAVVQIPRPITVGETTLGDGYYQIKIVISEPPQANPDPKVRKAKDLSYEKRKVYPTVTPAKPGAPESSGGTKVALMVKREGNTQLLVPVQRSEPLPKPIKEGATAQLVTEPDNPASPEVMYLKYCVRSICYRSEPLSPNLVK